MGWIWGKKEGYAFLALLSSLSTTPVLAHLDETAEITLRTDASVSGLGAVMSQGGKNGKGVVAYLSRTLTPAESRWTTNNLECLAVVWAVEKRSICMEGS